MRDRRTTSVCSSNWPRIRGQLEYLNRFAGQLESGQQPMDGRFVQRAQMYAQAARGTYEEVRRQGEIAGGMTKERLVTHSLEGCDSCAADEALGWVPIGTLGEIGSRQCLTACLCTMEYWKGGDLPADDEGMANTGVPQAEEASVHDNKLGGYLLDPLHPVGGGKYEFLRRFGFREDDPETLRAALLEHVRSNAVTKETETEYGTKWEVRGSRFGLHPLV